MKLMKNLLFLTFLLSSIHYGYSQNIDKVDSLFNRHIKSISDSISKYATSDEIKVYTYKVDVTFLRVLSEISDFKFEEQGYTHQPMLNKRELNEIKKWYKKYRKKLNWAKIDNLFKIYEGYNNAYKLIKPDDPSSYELYEQTLDSLDIEHKRLYDINTFIIKSND